MSNEEKKKYPVGPIDPDQIVRRVCPSGYVQELYPVQNRLTSLSFMKSGYIPDYRTHAPAVRQMAVYPDDVLICAFPKAGTHWVWEIAKMLVKGEAEYDPHPKEVAMLEFHGLELFQNMARPRVMNTHIEVHDLPSAFREGVGKVIFIQRNPKDVTVSFYNHLVHMKSGKFGGTWEDFVYLVNNYGGYHLDWFKYTLEFAEEFRNNSKMKWYNMYYEDVKKDPMEAISNLANFLEVPCTQKLAMDIAEKCSFAQMKNANETLKFDFVNNTRPNPEFENPGAMYRKGEIGDWKNWFTVAQNAEFDQMFRERMKDCPFSYTFTSDMH